MRSNPLISDRSYPNLVKMLEPASLSQAFVPSCWSLCIRRTKEECGVLQTDSRTAGLSPRAADGGLAMLNGCAYEDKERDMKRRRLRDAIEEANTAIT